jgi:flagellum-specific peptidoglycan hydrolase FlgJ
MVQTRSEFRNFTNLEDYVNFKIDFVGRSRYDVFSHSPNEYIDRVAAGGYATDPNYAGKVKNILSEISNMI